MILIDSSVWIDFFNASPGPAGAGLKRLIEQSEPVVLSGIIVTEVLQGLKRDVEPIEVCLGRFDLLEPQGYSTYRRAAVIYRLARAFGVTLATVDALIATLAIENGAALFTLDRNFTQMTRFTDLHLYEL